MLTEDAVAALIETAGEFGTYFDGTPWVEIADHQAVIVSMSGGSAPQFELAFDQVAVQILTRGDQRDHAGARTLAYAIDTLLLSCAPTTLTGTYVASVNRFGGPPRLLERDAAFRFIFSCNYLCLAARTT